MFDLIQRFLDWIKSLFWKEELELTLVGLQNSGKTTFVNVITSGQFTDDMIPTVGFNMKKITKGNVTIKVNLIEILLYFKFIFLILFSFFQFSTFLFSYGKFIKHF